MRAFSAKLFQSVAGFCVLLALQACVSTSKLTTITQPPVVQCNDDVSVDALPYCEILDIGDAGLIIAGTILGTDATYENGRVLIDENGVIAAVGCDVSSHDLAETASTLSCPGNIISPGFINPHDHIQFTHQWPSPATDERSEHRHQWRLGLDGRSAVTFEAATVPEQIAWGELRQILSGTTSVAGMGGVPGLVRNLEH